MQAGGSSQEDSHHGSDLALAEVAEYLASDTNKLPSMGSLGSTSAEPHVFRPGWEDIFRMNQKQLEVRTSVESTIAESTIMWCTKTTAIFLSRVYDIVHDFKA